MEKMWNKMSDIKPECTILVDEINNKKYYNSKIIAVRKNNGELFLTCLQKEVGNDTIRYFYDYTVNVILDYKVEDDDEWVYFNIE